MHATSAELESGLDVIRQSPQVDGVLEMIVRRPAVNEREVLEEATLDLAEGLVGDNWKSRSGDGGASLDMQLNVMNARAIALVARERDRWKLAGDQLFVDFDLCAANVPPGTQLAIGGAVIEVTDVPHLGCRKFRERFGPAALEFVNSPVGRELHLRGVNARIVQPGVIRAGDAVRKLKAELIADGR